MSACASDCAFEGGRMRRCVGNLCAICPGNETGREREQNAPTTDKEDEGWHMSSDRVSEGTVFFVCLSACEIIFHF